MHMVSTSRIWQAGTTPLSLPPSVNSLFILNAFFEQMQLIYYQNYRFLRLSFESYRFFLCSKCICMLPAIITTQKAVIMYWFQ